ncbi:MAG: citramalate synthase [Nitrospinae bacterium]|nr:citramalate synthase [Nitrospinota bacterium]
MANKREGARGTHGKKVFVYDTTLRDGSQSEGVSFSLTDKLRITEKLDELGVHYIEGGWPGSNPKDVAYFKEVRKLKLKTSKIAAFGSTHHPSKTAATDPNLKLLLDCKAPVVTIFGKTWDAHVSQVLRISREKNLDVIRDSIKHLKKKVGEVIFDAEHFFDGYKSDAAYALQCLSAAIDGGADWLVLCDTNGGGLPSDVFDVTSLVVKKFKHKTGIHCHNDGEMVVANTVMAVQAGASQIHVTVNGMGERCGNADLCAVVPNLQLKLGYRCLTDAGLKRLRDTSLLVSELANMKPRIHQPFVGQSAFAHKGGIHVDAVLKNPATYEHIQPEKVGNVRRVLVSDLSGKATIMAKAGEFGIDMKADPETAREIVTRIKHMENQGYQFEGADGSLEILIKKARGHWKKYFEVRRALVTVSVSSGDEGQYSEAVVVIKTPDGQEHHAAADGNGPVNAMDKAFRQALSAYYPELKGVRLLDFKVRILDETKGTSAKTRVLILSGDETGEEWGTVGVSENVIEASWQALVDSIDYRLHKKAVKPVRGSGKD